MKKLYDYLFYRIYVEWKKQDKNDAPQAAMFALSLLIGFNATIILSIFEKSVLRYRIFHEPNTFIFVPIAIIAINSYLFLYKGEYKKIEERFKNETKREKRLSSIAILSLVGITLAQIVYLFLR